MTVHATSLQQERTEQSLPRWKRFPTYGYIAGAVNLTVWFFAWSRIDPWYRYSFFALWFSFILFVDALVKARRGTSLLTRAPAKFAQLFVFSTLFWWLFEAFNIPVQNWHYVMDQPYTALQFNLIATLNFTTVLPAVMEIAEFWTSFPRLRPRMPASFIGERASEKTITRLIALGVACVILPCVFPRQTFILIWLSLALVLDPINNLIGRKSALAHLKARDWRFLLVLPLSGLTCGFFWEMWNSQSLPKWQYTIPYVGFGKVFEMPILGYTGYLPFALELFAMYQFLLAFFGQRDDALAF
ncbi:MAG TPA: hypothetical protein VH540_03230 [Ktedonobacterales bacterium]|jgi:hypothetical protein